MQTLALTMLTLLYFIGNFPPQLLHTTHLTTPNYPTLHQPGVLLKTGAVETSDQEDLGVLMVLLLVSVIMAAIGTAALEMYTARGWMGKITHAFKIRYEGKVQEERGVPCIASFPGKFEDEWSEVVALGSEEKVGAVSVACVYHPAPYSTIRAACERSRDWPLLL
jgi:hypothetical protein